MYEFEHRWWLLHKIGPLGGTYKTFWVWYWFRTQDFFQSLFEQSLNIWQICGLNHAQTPERSDFNIVKIGQIWSLSRLKRLYKQCHRLQVDRLCRYQQSVTKVLVKTVPNKMHIQVPSAMLQCINVVHTNHDNKIRTNKNVTVQKGFYETTQMDIWHWFYVRMTS